MTVGGTPVLLGPGRPLDVAWRECNPYYMMAADTLSEYGIFNDQFYPLFRRCVRR